MYRAELGPVGYNREQSYNLNVLSNFCRLSSPKNKLWAGVCLLGCFLGFSTWGREGQEEELDRGRASCIVISVG